MARPKPFLSRIIYRRHKDKPGYVVMLGDKLSMKERYEFKNDDELKNILSMIHATYAKDNQGNMSEPLDNDQHDLIQPNMQMQFDISTNIEQKAVSSNQCLNPDYQDFGFTDINPYEDFTAIGGQYGEIANYDLLPDLQENIDLSLDPPMPFESKANEGQSSGPPNHDIISNLQKNDLAPDTQQPFCSATVEGQSSGISQQNTISDSQENNERTQYSPPSVDEWFFDQQASDCEFGEIEFNNLY